MSFTLRLLGLPHYLAKNTWSALPDNQALMLSAYLASQEDWVSRDALLSLFWPDEEEKTARHNLSQLLYQSKQQKWAKGLETERSRAKWQIMTDVHVFREAFAEGNWQEAIDVYSGPFLEGIRSDAFIEFDDWLAAEREDLQAAWREAVLKYCSHLEQSQQQRKAIPLLKQVLKQDSLAEDVLQSYLRFAKSDGQREAALKTYTRFKEQLQQELALEPLEETVLLAEQLRTTKAILVTQEVTTKTREIPVAVLEKPSLDPNLTNFPHYLTPFVGRELELAEFAAAFKDPERRLLTLFGPGGMGKSRLAIELALENAALFEQGASFVPLANVSSSDLVVSAFADALSFAASTNQPLEEQLFAFLAPQDLLLVIDNFEHVLEASELVLAMLEAAPKLKILVTSREPLGFQAEWLYELKGMNVPNKHETKPIELSSSVQLFVRTARRALPQFQLEDKDKALVATICRLLSGMPLGIELAAQWIRLLSIQEIADELSHSLDFLETTHRDLPTRHHSLRAVFDYSWQLLSEAQRTSLKELSVFQAGFSKDAASQISSASLRTLLSLVNKSLLSRTQTGRFEQLNIVQQYAHEKLTKDSSLTQRVKAKHAAYYLGLAKKAEPELVGAKQAAWLKTLSTEHDNFRAALSFYKDNQDFTEGLELAASLCHFWFMRSYLTEGLSHLSFFLEHSPAASEARAKALRGAGVLAERQHDLQTAETLFEESLALSRELKDEQVTASILNNLANLAFRKLEYTKAKRLYSESLEIYRKANVAWRMAIGLSNLGLVASLEADYKAAEAYLKESLELSKAAENSWMIASTLSKLADLAQHQINYSEAEIYYQESLALKQSLGDFAGAASLKTNLASLAFFQNNTAKARSLIEESITELQSLDAKQSLTTAYYHLALIEQAENNLSKARALLQTCLSTFETSIGICKSLDALALIALKDDKPEQGVILIAASDALLKQAGMLKTAQETNWLEPYLKKAEQSLSSEQLKQALIRGQNMTQFEALDFALKAY